MHEWRNNLRSLNIVYLLWSFSKGYLDKLGWIGFHQGVYATRGVSKTEKTDKLTKTNHIGSVFQTKKGQFSLRILKTDLVNSAFNFRFSCLLTNKNRTKLIF